MSVFKGTVNSDSSPLQWSRYPASGGHYDKVDETDETLNEADYVYPTDNAQTEIYDCETTTVASVSSVKVWLHGTNEGAAPDICVKASIYMGGSWQTLQIVPLPEDGNPADWANVIFNGTWTQADLNAMQIKLVSVSGSPTGYTLVNAIYFEATYEEEGPPAGRQPRPGGAYSPGGQIY